MKHNGLCRQLCRQHHFSDESCMVRVGCFGRGGWVKTEEGVRKERPQSKTFPPEAPHSFILLSSRSAPSFPRLPSRTINTAKSAGVIPLMRLAWARSTG